MIASNLVEKVADRTSYKVPERCEYPDCSHKREMMCDILVANKKDENERPIHLRMAFCKFHWHIVIGGHFTVDLLTDDVTDPQFKLNGPFKEVEIILQVISALEAVKLIGDEK
jgi:hypothetical protein